MENPPSPSHPPQICLSASKKSGVLLAPANASLEDRKYTEVVYLSVVFQYTSGLAHLPYELRYMNPHPVMVSRQFLDDLEQFHHAITTALNHIVQRWCSDKEAAFAKRMPLEPHEEELLQVFGPRIMVRHHHSPLTSGRIVGVSAKRKQRDAFI
jgi:hypothetical protein